MVKNEFAVCEVCDTIINFRIQMGYYDIPVHVHCPNCEISIDGKIMLKPYQFQVNNIKVIEDHPNEFYSFELSAEFITRKMIYKNITDIEVSPFLRSDSFNGDSNHEPMMVAIRDAMYFADFLKNEWTYSKRFYELLWNNKTTLLCKQLNEKIKKSEYIAIKHVSCELEAVIAIHQILISSGVSIVLGKNILKEFIAATDLMVHKIYPRKNFIEWFNLQKFEFNAFEKKMVELIDMFSIVYEQIIPVVSLRNTDSLDSVDTEEFGISIASIEDLTSFYANSFEWLMQNFYIIIIFNNIIIRDNFQNCINNKTIEDFNELTSGQKLNSDFIDFSEPFAKPISSLQNKIRNSIQHFDSKIDYKTQTITFSDRHKTQEKSFIEFVDMCIDNFRLMFYIFEMFYNLRKVSLLKQAGNIGVKRGEIGKTRKTTGATINTGRNALCTCGSGKKYKRCCGK